MELLFSQRLSSTYVRCAGREFGYPPKIRLVLLPSELKYNCGSPPHVDHRKCCQLSSTDDRRQFITLNIHLCVQHDERIRSRHGTGSHFVTQRPSDPGIQRPGDPVDPVTLFYNELQMSTYVADKCLQWARGLPVFIAVWRLDASGK